MYAISIRQPWAWAILNAGKNVENRSWPVPAQFIGKRIALHAGKQIDKNGIAFLMENGVIVPRSISGTLTSSPQLDFGAIVGSVEIIDCIFNHPSPWAMPQHYHWLLQNPRKFDQPIPWKGRLGFFEVPLDVLEN